MNNKQMKLPFIADSLDDGFRSNFEKNGYKVVEEDIGDITFQAGQKESIHRWYRLTPSYSPSFVRHFIEEYNINCNSFVYDPFAGRGTTSIECQKVGIPCLSTEVNPLFALVLRYSLKWDVVPKGLFEDYLDILNGEIRSHENENIETVLEEKKTHLPDIHHVFRWWKTDVLKDLIIAKELMGHKDFKRAYHFIWLAINSAALECANIHRNHPTITFDDNHKRRIDVYEQIKHNLLCIQSDLASLCDDERKNSELSKTVLYSSCDNLQFISKDFGEVTHVITSPPYPNRFSYVHQTRPQLHFMDVIGDRKEATDIDLRAIGGTWGRATSNLQKQFIEPPKHLRDILDYIPSLKKESLLMCNYATKYFLEMDNHVRNLRPIVSKDFRGTYLVGNSRLKGVEIFTENILANIFEINGFKVDSIDVFRRRGGRKRIYESAVRVRA